MIVPEYCVHFWVPYFMDEFLTTENVFKGEARMI